MLESSNSNVVFVKTSKHPTNFLLSRLRFQFAFLEKRVESGQHLHKYFTSHTCRVNAQLKILFFEISPPAHHAQWALGFHFDGRRLPCRHDKTRDGEPHEGRRENHPWQSYLTDFRSGFFFIGNSLPQFLVVSFLIPQTVQCFGVVS